MTTDTYTLVPEPADILKKKPMTELEVFFELKLKNRELDHKPGQFAEISIPGIGEAPISVSSSPSKTGSFEMVIRNAGSVTNALHGMEAGDTVGIRGPYGTHFPVDEMKGKDILFVAGGIGLVPARSAILYVLENREDYNNVNILFGSRDPSQRLFTDELAEWDTRSDIEFLETVDEGDDSWEGNIGVVTTLFDMLSQKPDPASTYAVVVGPPVMYKFVIISLRDLGFTDDHIIVSLERHMKCGVGVCGHCQINGIYVCQEGPVFSLDQISDLPEAI